MNRNLPRIIIIIVAVVGVAIFSIINSGSDEILNFNDKIVDLLGEMDNSYADYISELDNYYMEYEVDVELLDKEANEIKDVTEQIKIDVENINVPDHDICREFYRVALDYVQNSVDFYGAYFDVNEYIKIYNTPGGKDLQYVDDKLDHLYFESERILNELVAVQERMAVQFDFELE